MCIRDSVSAVEERGFTGGRHRQGDEARERGWQVHPRELARAAGGAGARRRNRFAQVAREPDPDHVQDHLQAREVSRRTGLTSRRMYVGIETSVRRTRPRRDAKGSHYAHSGAMSVLLFS